MHLKIKKAITGRGSASKEQVADVTNTQPKEMPKYLDATDGLLQQFVTDYKIVAQSSKTNNYSSWSNFVKDNENRVKKG